jgi:hypothetical protein
MILEKITQEMLSNLWENAGMECGYWAETFGWTHADWVDRFPAEGICVDVHYDDGLKIAHKALTLAEMHKGLELMEQKFPKHYADLMNGNDDAITADVAVQMMLFGEIVYS